MWTYLAGGILGRGSGAEAAAGATAASSLAAAAACGGGGGGATAASSLAAAAACGGGGGGAGALTGTISAGALLIPGVPCALALGGSWIGADAPTDAGRWCNGGGAMGAEGAPTWPKVSSGMASSMPITELGPCLMLSRSSIDTTEPRGDDRVDLAVVTLQLCASIAKYWGICVWKSGSGAGSGSSTSTRPPASISDGSRVSGMVARGSGAAAAGFPPPVQRASVGAFSPCCLMSWAGGLALISCTSERKSSPFGPHCEPAPWASASLTDCTSVATLAPAEKAHSGSKPDELAAAGAAAAPELAAAGAAAAPGSPAEEGGAAGGGSGGAAEASPRPAAAGKGSAWVDAVSQTGTTAIQSSKGMLCSATSIQDCPMDESAEAAPFRGAGANPVLGAAAAHAEAATAAAAACAWASASGGAEAVAAAPGSSAGAEAAPTPGAEAAAAFAASPNMASNAFSFCAAMATKVVALEQLRKRTSSLSRKCL